MTGKTKEIFSQADKLIEVGLDVPQITHLFNKLRLSGVELPESIFTIDDARKAILSYLNKRGGEQ